MNIRAVCFKADGEQTVAITKVGSAPAITMQYSYDGVNWDAWDLSALPFGGGTKVYVRGANNARLGANASNYNKITFSSDAFVYVSGVIESLLDGENEVLTYGYEGILRNIFYQQTALRSVENLRFEAISVNSGIMAVLAFMFAGCTNLLYAPKFLSFERFGGGYECAAMFRGCTSLVNAPNLPTTTLSQFCYRYMFQDCISLVTAPELPAMSTTYGCYQSMFQGCTSLVTSPELPATKVGESCYESMFNGCTSLVSAPELPATKLYYYVYRYMFSGCTSLKTIRCHAKVTGGGATIQWLQGVSTSGTFYGHSEYGWSSGTNGIPEGWEFVELTD